MSETKVYRNVNFQIVCSAGLMSMMTVSMVVPAFPTMAASLNVSEESIGLLITLYTLPSFILSPLSGIMADRIGRKRLLVPSLFLFGIFGFSCSLAPDFNTLLVLRVLQGVTGAPLGGVGGAIIGDIFTGRQRAEAMGINTTVMYGGYIIYPLVGGALAGLAWNYPFMPFALAIPLGFLALFFLHCPEPNNKQSLKSYFGNALKYIKSLKVLWLFSSTMLTYILLYGAFLTYFSILLGDRFEASSFIIGLFISILGLVTALSSLIVGRLSRRFSVISLITGAFIIYAVAMALMMVLPGLWFYLLPTVLFGIAHGLNLPSQRVIAAGVAPLENRAGFMALSGTMTLLGMTIGPMIMALVFSLTSLNTTFLAAALIALIIPLMTLIIGKARLTV